MTRIHTTLQGKGGVGKSFVSTVLAQYKIDHGQTPLCIDTDPVNATFAGFKALNVRRLEILDDGEINSRKFDAIMEMIGTAKDDVIIDNGASSFIPLSRYLLDNDVPSMLADMGHELIIHTVVTGGQTLEDTNYGFHKLASQFPAETSQLVVWLNPYWGPVEHEGKTFEQLKSYRENKDRVAAIIQIPMLKEETFGHDLTEMLQERLTFSEAIASSSRAIMARQRLKIIRDRLYAQLDNATVL